MKAKLYLFILLVISILDLNAQVGIGTTSPATTLDVNGAITLREIEVAVSANTANIPANVSMVKLTGTATGAISTTAPAAPNAGQRLMIYNNTTGGFSALVNGFNVPAGLSMEFVYSSNNWQCLSATGSSFIPYASGSPLTATTLATGAVGTIGLMGFGNSSSGIGVTGSAINLTGGLGIDLNLAFLMPRNGVIKSINAVFSNVVTLNLGADNVVVKAQLYSNDLTSQMYYPIPGASVNLSPNMTGTVAPGQVFSGTLTGLSLPVNNNTRIVMGISATTTGVLLARAVTGYVSAGVTFD